MENLMYVCGAVIQYLRAQPWFQEWMAFLLLLVVGAVGFWLSSADSTAHGARFFVLGWLEYTKAAAATTAGVSLLANIAVKAGANPDHPAIPVTSESK